MRPCIKFALAATTLSVVAASCRPLAADDGPFRTAEWRASTAPQAPRPAVLTGDGAGKVAATPVRWYGRGYYGRPYYGYYRRPYYAYRPYVYYGYRPYGYYGYRPYAYPYYGGYYAYPGRVVYGWRGYPGVYYRW